MAKPDSDRADILVAIDYSDVSTIVVERALALAQRQSPCNLHFLHATEFRTDDESPEASHLELLAWLAARLPQTEAESTGISIKAHVASGDPWRVIVQMASDLSADLVVMGTHGRQGLDRVMLGSVAEAVSRHCGCSVLVVRRQSHGRPFVELEPVCGACVEARLRSRGKTSWCNDHVSRTDRRQAHYRRSIGRWIREHFSS